MTMTTDSPAGARSPKDDAHDPDHLTDAEREAVEAANRDIAEGRVHSHEEVGRMIRGEQAWPE